MSRKRGGHAHETEVWKTPARRLDDLIPEESRARHARMMGVIAMRIERLRLRLRGAA